MIMHYILIYFPTHSYSCYHIHGFSIGFIIKYMKYNKYMISDNIIKNNYVNGQNI